MGRGLAIRLKDKFQVVIGGRNNAQNERAQRTTGCESFPLDICDIESVRDAVNRFKPTHVIHAAASKFVGMAERFPNEAIDVNIHGSQNVARVCIDNNVESVIGISTDKAAPPLLNMYSLTKSVMERLYVSLNASSSTNFMCVRFGNIAWSSGSVFPIWEEMQQKSGVIESTGSTMKRYFFSRDDAVSLVENCLKYRDVVAGKILTLDMKTAQIGNILEVWVEKFGGEWRRISERPGDSPGEFLIGDCEESYTAEITLEDNRHFLISPGVKVANPVTSNLNTDTAECMSDTEIEVLLDSKPSEL